jgi:hypothetical protein
MGAGGGEGHTRGSGGGGTSMDNKRVGGGVALGTRWRQS